MEIEESEREERILWVGLGFDFTEQVENNIARC